VSGELKVTKTTGSLYRYIRDKESIDDSTRWLHIGDNVHSDYIVARRNGITSYHYLKPTDRFEIGRVSAIGDSIIRALQINGQLAADKTDYWYRFGWEIVGPIFIGLMFWLARQLRGKDNIYFLSRDGYMPYRLYNMMRDYDPELPIGYYLYASRRAFIYPQLPFEDRAYALDILTAHNPALGQKLTVKDIFINLNLDSNKYKEQLENFKLTVETIVNEDSIERVNQFLEFIWEDIVGILSEEKETLMKYLNGMGVHQYSTLNIFDIGWRGSTHLAMQRLLDKPVQGYYFGTTKNIFEEIKDRSFGYAFDRGDPVKYKKMIFEHIMMYELVFSAPEGSVVRFIKDNESGGIYPYLKDVEKNEELYEIINLFQRGATDLFKQALLYNKYIQVSKEFALSKMSRFIRSYRAEDLLKFSKLTNSIGLGEAHAVKRYVSCYDIEYYLANRKKCDREANTNLWKHAIVIRDHQGRHFNKEEIRKLYGLRRGFPELNYQRCWKLLKKAIKNPRKALRKLTELIARTK
jgi:predicted HAD superfamily hydrolase